MLFQTITSRDNEKIKLTAKLLSGAKFRHEAGLFVLEGLRLCLDAARSGAEIETLIFSDEALESGELETLAGAAKEVLRVPESLYKRVSDTASPQGILCVCRMKPPTFTVRPKGRYLMLEDISNPLNLGAVARTAEAFAFDGLVLSENCCDIYNPKALRASMGSLLRIPARITDLERVADEFTGMGIGTFAAVLDGDAVPVAEADFSGGAAVAIGNEANGLSRALIDKCGVKITIPIPGRAESLNAAGAAAIIIYMCSR